MSENNKIYMSRAVDARPLPALVSKVLDSYTLVINRGMVDGLRKGQKFLVYSIQDEVIDPETGESLGHLEVVRGRGVITHVQEKMATLKSDETAPSKVVKKRNLGLLAMGTEVIEESDSGPTLPFEGAEVNDSVKPI